MQGNQKATLLLEDGSSYSGYSFGAPISQSGEVVFTTGMVGYPESLTDPSFRGQILVCTYPLIGNYGVPLDKTQDGISLTFESNQIQVQGLIVAEYSDTAFHWQAAKTLQQWLCEQNVPAISGIDTRALTKKLREKGVMLGKIVMTNSDSPIHGPPLFQFENPNERNLVADVSCKEPILYERGQTKIIMIDCGVKNNIIHNFLQRDISVLRVPWDYDFTQENYDGIFVSNGPGDPTQCQATIHHLKLALTGTKPIFGICLGSQILALASGAKTYKLKYGHRGQNQPCLDTTTKRCYITSQNHGYAVDEKTLSPEWEPFLTNANDASNEGIRHRTKPFFAVQFHPEASPGPTDTQFYFDEFIKMIHQVKK